MPGPVSEKRIPSLRWTSFLFITVFIAHPLWAADDIQWLDLETRFTIVRYQSQEDLDAFDKAIEYSPLSSSSGLKWLFSDSGKKRSPEKLKDKMDALYGRAQEILGMRKRQEIKVKINIYRDKDQLKQAFYDIYKQTCRFRAWYIFETNTIYVTIVDLHEGMLAHEMAHSIIDHYLTVRPPSASAEILARYVDSHLHE